MRCFAAVIDVDAPRLGTVGAVPDRWCVVLGNEHRGVSEEVRRATGVERVRIRMAPGVDSLSINNACAVLLHGLREREADEAW